VEQVLINIEEIKSLLHHRYPFLLIDRVLDVQKNDYIKAIKNVTVNEPQFTGHFPHASIMPGVLIIESMAQASGILAIKSFEIVPKNTYLTSIDNSKFRSIVVPGDTMHIISKLIKRIGQLVKFKTEVTVDGREVASATLSMYWQ
jgi:3-hydroxyacyl-[acyl-carrier-protein] dehydratase